MQRERRLNRTRGCLHVAAGRAGPVVLCCSGLMVVRARAFVNRLGPLGTRTQRFVPLGAVVVSLVGAGIVANAIFAYVANGPN